jgi:hypothetical protein
MGKLRTIVESLDYADQLRALGTITRIDEALRGVKWALARGAEAYPPLQRSGTLRMIKAEGMHKATNEPPYALVLYFIIRSEDEVELLWIEKQEVEEE